MSHEARPQRPLLVLQVDRSARESSGSHRQAERQLLNRSMDCLCSNQLLRKINSLIVAEIYIKCTFLCMYVDDCCFCWQEIPDGEEKKSFHRYKHFGKLYVIFNPFNIGAWYLWREIMLSISHLIYRCLSWLDDAVYMEDEMERDEYVMAENGRIYTGNSRQIYGRPWNFGQVNCSFSTKA